MTIQFPNVLVLTLLLGGCVHHVTPLHSSLEQRPNGTIGPARATAFVDQSGTFYPVEWVDSLGAPGHFGGFALATVGRDERKTAYIERSEAQALDELAGFAADRERLFIFVHGYNSSWLKTQRGYEALYERLVLGPDDGVIEFYWNGLYATGPGPIRWIGRSAIWFNAAGYSQLAGTRGLRRLLNRIEDTDIYIIAHSRGASVTLSALSDPPYDADFVCDSYRYHHLNVFENPVLRDQGNRITVALLAPAIGSIDFRSSDFPADTSYRELGTQLVGVHYTVNSLDPALRKWVAPLADNFNPTNLGFDGADGAALERHYRDLHAYPVDSLASHAFAEYVRHGVFEQIMEAVGVSVRDERPR